MLENALTHGTDFRSTDGSGNGLVEHLDLAAVSTSNQIVDLLPIVGTAICHSQQDALDFQFRVDLPSNFLDGLQKLFQAFRRQVLCLHGNQGGICRCQRIHSQHPKGRGAIQQDKVVFSLCTVQHLLEHLFPVHAVDERHFHPCQFDIGWNQVNTFCMVQDTFAGRNTLIVHGFLHQGGKGGGQFIGLLPAHADGQAALWVSVHQQDFFALHRQPDTEILTGGGFSSAAFLVDDGNCGCFL